MTFGQTLKQLLTLSGIKSRTVGDGQHGTARWATAKEIQRIYAHVPFRVREGSSGHNRTPKTGLGLGGVWSSLDTLWSGARGLLP